VASATLLANCGGSRSDSPPPPIRVGVPIVLTMAPFYLALERAYFRDEGLVVEPEEVQFAGNQAQLMAAGRLDAGFMSMSPALLSAVSRGAALRVVCGREYISSTCRMTGEIAGRIASFPAG